MKERLVSIEWNGLNLEQMLYVNAVVMPKIYDVIGASMEDIMHLKDVKCIPLCTRDCEHCVFEEVCIERKGE